MATKKSNTELLAKLREDMAPLQRERFAELREQRDAIFDTLRPLYVELEGRPAGAREDVLREEIKRVREPLAEIDAELSSLTRELAGGEMVAKTAI